MPGFFKWFNINNFMDTHQEWHAWVEGFSDGFCVGPSHYEPNPTLLNELGEEHHYYNAGRGFGFASFILLVTGMIVWVARSIIRACAQL